MVGLIKKERVDKTTETQGWFLLKSVEFCSILNKNRKGDYDMSIKKMSVANFNTVFLLDDEERPMLDYFDTIIMPALLSGFEKKMSGDTYLFKYVNVVKNHLDFVLIGVIIKKPTSEVSSNRGENEEIIDLDYKYLSAPYSTFVLYLRNHRMMFVENQEGSPKLDNFRTTVKYVIDKYINKQNKILEKNNKDLLPIPLINIVGIPTRKRIEAELKKMSEITKLTLRFYPLNGCTNITSVQLALAKEVMQSLGVKDWELILKNPENITEIINMLAKGEGDFDYNVEGRDKNKLIKKIGNDEMSERIDADLSGESYRLDIDNIIEVGNNIESISYSSAENNKIYERNTDKIILFHRRKNKIYPGNIIIEGN